MAVGQAVQEWELGKAAGHQAMRDVVRLVHEWRPLEEYSVVYPSADTLQIEPVESEEAPGYGR